MGGSVKHAEDYFQQQCTGPYEYSSQLCESLAVTVFEGFESGPSASFQPDEEFCLSVVDLLKADQAHQQSISQISSLLQRRANNEASRSADMEIDATLTGK